jgi:hypothetical protein
VTSRISTARRSSTSRWAARRNVRFPRPTTGEAKLAMMSGSLARQTGEAKLAVMSGSLARYRERARVRDICAARLSVAPHIRNRGKFGPSPAAQGLAPASPDDGRGKEEVRRDSGVIPLARLSREHSRESPLSYPIAPRLGGGVAQAAGRSNDVARLIVNLAQIERAYLGLKFDRDGLTEAECEAINGYRPPTVIR